MSQTPSLRERLAVAAIGAVLRVRWGYAAAILPAVVASLGPVGALRWFAAHVPPMDLAFREWGPLRGNLLCTLASLLNGCAYCTYAHARAFQLYYFEARGELFPVDENALLSLIPLTDEEVRDRLEQLLRTAGLDEELALFHRLYALKLEGVTPGPADRHLLHAIHMFDVLNACAIRDQTPLDDAHDAIYKNGDLKRRYAEARLAAASLRRAQASEQPSDVAER